MVVAVRRCDEQLVAPNENLVALLEIGRLVVEERQI